MRAELRTGKVEERKDNRGKKEGRTGEWKGDVRRREERRAELRTGKGEERNDNR